MGITDRKELQWENQHNWATVEYNGNVIMCHFLCFLGVIAAKKVISIALDDIDKLGMYAIVHFVDQNVMCSHKSTKLDLEQCITKDMHFMWIQTVS